MTLKTATEIAFANGKTFGELIKDLEFERDRLREIVEAQAHTNEVIRRQTLTIDTIVQRYMNHDVVLPILEILQGPNGLVIRVGS